MPNADSATAIAPPRMTLRDRRRLHTPDQQPAPAAPTLEDVDRRLRIVETGAAQWTKPSERDTKPKPRPSSYARDRLASLGMTIRRRRNRLALTLQELGILSSISKPYLSLIETDKANPPSDEMLGRLETALKLPAGELQLHAHLLITPADVLKLIPNECIAIYLRA